MLNTECRVLKSNLSDKVLFAGTIRVQNERVRGVEEQEDESSVESKV